MYPDTVRIVLSGHADPGKILNIFNSGSVYKFFTKPWDAASLREQILDAFAYRDAQSRRSDSASALDHSTNIAHRTARRK
jgi:FixJ family two-component response regulator